LQIRHVVLQSILSFVRFRHRHPGFQCDQAQVPTPDNAKTSAAQPLKEMTQSLFGNCEIE
jgi:hypothetical protein